MNAAINRLEQLVEISSDRLRLSIRWREDARRAGACARKLAEHDGAVNRAAETLENQRRRLTAAGGTA